MAAAALARAGGSRVLLPCRSSSSSCSSNLFLFSSKQSIFSLPPSASPRVVTKLKPSSFLSRLPVELACGQSLMPLHSATASALLKSMLSSKPGNWGWVSEGFATPL